MSNIDDLINCDPFDYNTKTNKLFIKALNEAVVHNFDNCPQYKNYLEYCKFSPVIKKEEDITKLPPIHVNVYKEYDLKSTSDDKIVLTLTSSGTTGKKSKIFLDKISLNRVKKIAKNVYNALGMVNEKELVNYCCFTYDPHVANDLGTAFTDELLSSFTQKKSVYYTFQYNLKTGEFAVDLDKVVRILQGFEKDGLPVRLVGFPAFIYEVLEYYKNKYKKRFKFNPDSFVMTGGGWKKQEDKKVGRDYFVNYIHEMTSIPYENMRDLFGMVEHGVPYVECKHGNMHVPVYSKVFIKDPKTLKNLSFGQPGLANFVTPYLHSYPAVSILVNDFATLEPSCECGLGGNVLKIIGRAGISKHAGCALHAEQTVHYR